MVLEIETLAIETSGTPIVPTACVTLMQALYQSFFGKRMRDNGGLLGLSRPGEGSFAESYTRSLGKRPVLVSVVVPGEGPILCRVLH